MRLLLSWALYEKYKSEYLCHYKYKTVHTIEHASLEQVGGWSGVYERMRRDESHSMRHYNDDDDDNFVLEIHDTQSLVIGAYQKDCLDILEKQSSWTPLIGVVKLRIVV